MRKAVEAAENILEIFLDAPATLLVSTLTLPSPLVVQFRLLVVGPDYGQVVVVDLFAELS